MPHWRVIVSAPYAMPCIDRYRHALEAEGCDVESVQVRERLEEEELIALLPGAHGISAEGGTNRRTRLVPIGLILSGASTRSRRVGGGNRVTHVATRRVNHATVVSGAEVTAGTRLPAPVISTP